MGVVIADTLGGDQEGTMPICGQNPAAIHPEGDESNSEGLVLDKASEDFANQQSSIVQEENSTMQKTGIIPTSSSASRTCNINTNGGQEGQQSLSGRKSAPTKTKAYSPLISSGCSRKIDSLDLKLDENYVHGSTPANLNDDPDCNNYNYSGGESSGIQTIFGSFGGKSGSDFSYSRLKASSKKNQGRATTTNNFLEEGGTSQKKNNYADKKMATSPESRWTVYFLFVVSLLKFFLALSVLSLLVGSLWWFHVRLAALSLRLSAVERVVMNGPEFVHPGESRNAREEVEQQGGLWNNGNLPPFPGSSSSRDDDFVINEVGNGKSVSSSHSGQPPEPHQNDQFMERGGPPAERLRVCERAWHYVTFPATLIFISAQKSYFLFDFNSCHKLHVRPAVLNRGRVHTT